MNLMQAEQILAKEVRETDGVFRCKKCDMFGYGRDMVAHEHSCFVGTAQQVVHEASMRKALEPAAKPLARVPSGPPEDRPPGTGTSDLLRRIEQLEKRFDSSDAARYCGPFKTARLVRAARDLIRKMDAIHDDPKYRAVWENAQLRQGPYSGPKYADELQALREIVDDLLPEAM